MLVDLALALLAVAPPAWGAAMPAVTEPAGSPGDPPRATEPPEPTPTPTEPAPDPEPSPAPESPAPESPAAAPEADTGSGGLLGSLIGLLLPGLLP